MEEISRNLFGKRRDDLNKNKTIIDAKFQSKNTFDTPNADQPSNTRPRGLGEHLQIVFLENLC